MAVDTLPYTVTKVADDEYTPRSGQDRDVFVSQARLDLRPYYLGGLRRNLLIVNVLAWTITLAAFALDRPNVWAFTLTPALALLMALIVVTFDYATSDPAARPAMVRRRSRSG